MMYCNTTWHSSNAYHNILWLGRYYSPYVVAFTAVRKKTWFFLSNLQNKSFFGVGGGGWMEDKSAEEKLLFILRDLRQFS